MKLKSVLTAALLVFACASAVYFVWDEVHTSPAKVTSALPGNPSLPAPEPAKDPTSPPSAAVNAANEQGLASGLSRTRETQTRDSLSAAGLPVNPQDSKEVGAPSRLEKPTSTPAQKVIVYYFHGTNRCPTCLKMEAYAAEAVGTGFSGPLERGDLEWRVVNTDAPENKHFVEDYKLYTRSLVIVKVRNGKQIEWKNLEKIWDLVNDKRDFIKYVQEEISTYLGERQ